MLVWVFKHSYGLHVFDAIPLDPFKTLLLLAVFPSAASTGSFSTPEGIDPVPGGVGAPLYRVEGEIVKKMTIGRTVVYFSDGNLAQNERVLSLS